MKRAIGHEEMSRQRLALATEDCSSRYVRPQTRADCHNMPRPCPWLGCRHHLHAFVTDKGSLNLTHGRQTLEVLQDVPHSCSLDVADEGSKSLAEIGKLLNLNDETVRLIVLRALGKLARQMQ